MLTDMVRQWSRGLLTPIARAVNWTGLSPDSVTLIGFVLQGGVGIVLSQGYVQLGGALLIVAALFDALDGALARLNRRASRFGAFFDSTMDRFSEAAIFLGILIYFANRGARVEIALTYLTIVGSLMVSYTRARAEGVGVSIRGGIFTRFERVIVLILFLLLDQLPLAVLVLAPVTNLTALQRIWLTWRATRDDVQQE
jgi:CDP-diacylglycerol--glycerol-3-phosphate 3-phosphatidyltransferase